MKTALLVAVLGFAASPIFAQSQAAPVYRVNKVTATMARTPDANYSGGAPGKRSRNSSFLEVEASFDDVAPPSANKTATSDLALTFYVVLKTKGLPDPADRTKRLTENTMLAGTVNLINVPHEKELKAVMYISPRTLERYFEGKVPASAQAAVADAGVSISRDGQLAGQGAVSAPDFGNQKPWWTGMQPVSGSLLNKNETPFANLAWDYYEEIKPSGEGAK